MSYYYENDSLIVPIIAIISFAFLCYSALRWLFREPINENINFEKEKIEDEESNTSKVKVPIVFERDAAFNFSSCVPIAIRRAGYSTKYYEDTIISYKHTRNSKTINTYYLSCSLETHQKLVDQFNNHVNNYPTVIPVIGEVWNYKVLKCNNVNTGTIISITPKIVYIKKHNVPGATPYEITDIKFIELIEELK